MVFQKLLVAGAAWVAYKAIKTVIQEENAPLGSESGSSTARAVSSTLRQEAEELKKTVYTYELVLGEIRLLKLRTPSRLEPSYQFSRMRLSGKPVYDVLSYVWGTSPETSRIEIDGKDFPVTEHLRSALLKHSRDASNIPIWVDAICIEQANDNEKNTQVRQMSQIYINARRVFVWLGDEENDSGAAFDLLRSFGSPDEDAFTRAVIRSFQSRSHTRGWAAVAQILARSWWTRAWIFQEIIVAREAIMWCGHDFISWEVFASLAMAMEEHRDIFLLDGKQPLAAARIMENHHHLYNLALYRRQRRLFGTPSLSQALQIRRSAGAKDPRDKVFALLGVTHEEIALPRSMRDGAVLTDDFTPLPDILVDYNKSNTVAEVYKRTAMHIIKKNQHLEILSACQNPDRRDGIPSWAPDWSVRRNNNPIVAPDSWGRIYSASGVDPGLTLIQGDASDTIILEGVYIDPIAQLSSVFFPPTRWNDIKLSWARMAMSCAKTRPDGTALRPGDPKQNDGRCAYVPGESISAAFLRSCCMDRVDEFRVAVESGYEPRLDAFDGELFQKETVARLDAIENRKFGVTKNGLMGLFPAETEEDDFIFCLTGADVPFVLRRTAREPAHNTYYVIVGECYVHNAMYADVIWDLDLPGRFQSGLRKEKVIIV